MSSKFNKSYEQYIKMFKKLCKELGRTLTSIELRSKDIDLPSDKWFIDNCPNKDIKTYRDFLNWLGYKSKRVYRKYNFEIASEEFAKKGLILLPQEYKSCAIKMKYICPNHPDIIQEKSLNNLIFYNNVSENGCYLCYAENNYGENHNQWKGGMSYLNIYLRDYIVEWKKASMFKCNYKCVITGKNFNAIHHLYSFNKIVKEAIEKNNLPIYMEIKDYSKEELDLLKSTVIDLHNKYPLGVCLCKEVHDLYHHIYGDDNTPEQFEEFKIKYNNGAFIKSIDNKKLISNKPKQKKVRKKYTISKESRKRINESKIKFNSEQVLEIREKYATNKYKQVELAKEYSTVISVISNIINYKGVYKNF